MYFFTGIFPFGFPPTTRNLTSFLVFTPFGLLTNNYSDSIRFSESTCFTTTRTNEMKWAFFSESAWLQICLVLAKTRAEVEANHRFENAPKVQTHHRNVDVWRHGIPSDSRTDRSRICKCVSCRRMRRCCTGSDFGLNHTGKTLQVETKTSTKSYRYWHYCNNKNTTIWIISGFFLSIMPLLYLFRFGILS